MSNDVAGATFMAAATSAPELFVNVIGTFITEGDLGVGTIVGSAVFNILAVAACCGIGAGMVVPLDWWPLTRDCLAYGITVSILICIIHDERVEWYEALTLVLLYIVYIAVMYYDKCYWPNKIIQKLFVAWVVTWPIHLVFLFTIPDCERKGLRSWFPLTFIMCIIWIGSLSYVVAWMITIIGDTLKIPDSVMGITFLAAGTSVPEAVSSVIVAKQGHGSMGISNSIGSNTFDILLCLGLPWLIKAALLPTEPGQHWVGINSAGLEYSAISLLSTLLMLYIAFSINKFKLDMRVGRACLLMYAVFLVLASLIELNAFFRVNLPTCGREGN
ncbi:sodium/potassium/calcium exchanger 3 [Ctenocephalides felis]|uniref:sodium/potassium/calcium exchanger 3 n=1 Tax=Ctenocephalides felis TaxID=7515 RepID=UPI000E6E34FF|nr:sodium/potassium/calcium exchanger 3 [Ctenocephalides felis]